MKSVIIAFVALIVTNIVKGQAVSIGAPSPNASAMLDVVSPNRGFLAPRMNSITRAAIPSPAAGLMVFDTTTGSYWYYNGSGWVNLAAASPSPWTINGTNIYNSNSGNVGIGTSATAPEHRLHVRSATSSEGILLEAVNPILQLRQSNIPDPGYSDVGFVQLAGNNIRIGTNSSNGSGQFVVRTGGDDRLFVDSVGNVSLGNSYKIATGYKLSVNGKIMAEGVRVQFDNNWPDYVFDKNYKLASLKEIEAFIKKERHLPDIPSAQDVLKDGIDLGEMNKKLLEKIEELTLHVIALDKKNAVLEFRISQIEKNK